MPTWIGFEGDDLIATIDLGSIEKIHEIKAGFLQNIGSWIFLPTQTEFLIGENEQSYQSVGEVFYMTSDKTEGNLTKDMLREINPGLPYICSHIMNT